NYVVELGKKPTKGVIKDGTYFPLSDQFGRDNFTYRLVGRLGDKTDFAHVEVDINPVNDAPQFTLDRLNAKSEPSETVIFTVTNIIDVDSSEHQITWSQVQGPRLLLSDAQSKALKVPVPSDALEGEQYRFSILVQDSSGGHAKQSVVVDVRRKQASLLGTKSLQVKYGDEINLVPNINGDVHTLYILESPRNGIAKIVDGKIIYNAPTQRKLALYDTIKYKALSADGGEWVGSFDIEVLPNVSNEPSVPITQSDSSGGSSSLPVLIILCLLFRLRAKR
ncbi:MAG TPA: hypothetical protein DCL21_02695, partial [Alphaproteobacteria bacterium]|nr:hypothetical protein [Alphaproteobacteria bacterium]